MITNAICTSGDNLNDIIYYKTDKGLYKIHGLRSYSVEEDEGSVIIEIENIYDIIANLQKAKRDVEEFNKMGS